MRKLSTLPILLLVATTLCAEDPLVILAGTRSGRIEAFDPWLTLEGSIVLGSPVASISASPDGRTLYLAQESLSVPGDCCGLYTLDLDTHKMCGFGPPSIFVIPSADGRYIFAQGDRGAFSIIDPVNFSFSAARMPGGSAYNLQPSPDGRWMMGLTNSGERSLDIFDLDKKTLRRRLPLPMGPATGAWVGKTFYVFSYSAPGTGRLWSVKPQDSELAESREIRLPDLHGACSQPVLLMLAGSSDKLFLSEVFGYKVDRRAACPGAEVGGIDVIDPSSGQVRRIASSIRVNRMAVTADGNDLYLIEAANPSHKGDVRLIHMDTRGRTVDTTLLESGDWTLALAHIPGNLIPRGYLRVAATCSR